MKNAYIVHEDSLLSKDMCERYVKLYGLNVVRIACPKSSKEKIDIVKDVFREAQHGNIDTVVFSDYQAISKNLKIAVQLLKNLQVAKISTTICFFEFPTLYADADWENEILVLVKADRENQKKKRKGG